MDELMHKLVSAVLVALLLTVVSAISVATRKRKVARAEGAAPAPAEDPTQALLREARNHDLRRDELAAQGHTAEALGHARAAAERWRLLTDQRPGRFLAERRAALASLAGLLTVAGHESEATRARMEADSLV
ncbi:hypothetical protein DN069_27095 [Streptacidiphilus pinicola]|uniref:Uncharacterized protein n=1 Tax=Streptacidiphilus pinicola TaxID=2219663 RepID=A0A2X0K5G8_9ACTN|nr:hypothetical protein [Streptacidiphilus pinicola]RAG82520.1 hypothetical protein DN069_27095 [Streptacidiphilus pinicola]